MAELIANWLNEEVGLSKRVTNFEEDFASGYLFGELLYKFNQQPDFEEFSTKNATSHYVMNFERLESTLRALKIQFNSKIVEQVMRGERGLALRLLYQIKMVLEKVYPPADISIVAKTGKFGDNLPAQKIVTSKPKYDDVTHEFFKQRLAKLNRAQKEIDLENHLQGFEAEKDRQASHAARLDSDDREADVLRKQEMRRIQINKLQRNAGFMEEWMQKGAEQWKSNMVKKREREQAQLDFDLSQAEKFNQQAENKLNDANIEVHEGIDKFEAALREKGISTKVDKEVAAAAVTATLTEGVTWAPSATMTNGQGSATKKGGSFGSGTMQQMATTKKGNYTLTSTGLKSRAKKTLTEDEQKQRIKRRRRLITHQEQLFTNLHAQTRETIVFEQMKRQSRQEKELDYEAWRTTQCKAIIQENRKLREQQYSRRKELDMETAVIKEERLIEEMCEGSKRSVEEMVKRTGELKEYEQELKKKQRTELCSQLMDKIFDIADEAFNHKQKLDAAECDQRNWDNWITLFVKDKPIAGTLNSISTAVVQEPEAAADDDELIAAAKKDAAEIEAATACTSEANEQLNQTELENYLRNKGEWPATLVSEKKLNLMDVLNPPADAAAAAGGKGAPKKAAAPTESAMDEADLTLTDEAENNFLLGDVIDQLIKLNFDERARTKHPQTPNWLNLKLSLVGYPFSGTHTQSKYIKERFGLDVFNMEELVQEAIDCPDEPVEPDVVSEVAAEQEVEAAVSDKKSEHEAPADVADATSAKGSTKNVTSPDAKSAHKSQNDFTSVQDEAIPEAPKEPSVCDNLSEDEDTAPNVKEELRQCGVLIREILLDGGEIPDELYVRLFINKLRATYEYKSPQQKMDEVKTEAQEICDINVRISEIDREMLTDLKEKQKVKKIEERNRLMARHEALQKLTANGWVLIDFPCNYAQAKLLEEALSGYKPSEELEPTMRESETTSAELLVKPNPKPEPPKTLIPSGLDLVMWFDCPIAECLRRADGRRFDADTPEMAFHVEDKVPPSTHAPLCERLLPLSEDNNCVNTLSDRFVAFDQTTNSMKKWFKQFGDEGQNRVLLQTVQAKQSKQEISSAIEKAVQQVLDKKAEKRNALREAIQAKFDANRIQQEELRLTKTPEILDASNAGDKAEGDAISADVKEAKSPAVTSTQAKVAASQDKVTASVDTVKSTIGGAAESTKISFERDNIDNDFRPVLIKMWQQMSVNYRGQMKTIFQSVRVHRERYFNIQSDLQGRFLEFLHRLDNKQECLDTFVGQFNEFTDEYPDLREDEQTKEELHQRTDVLSDELWEIVEERKESNTEERRKIMEAGEIEFGLEFLTLSAQQLMQAELDKFKVSVQIIHDYYHAVEEKNTPEVAGIPSCELAFEGDLPAVEFVSESADRSNIESYSYPRLEKLLAMALGMQAIPDVTQQAAAGGADKKGKAPAKGKPAAAEEAAVVEETVYVREMKEALRVEKSILRFRLVQIRNWSYQRLQELRNSAIKLYKKLDDWIQVAQKTEMDAIEEMCVIIKHAIESEAKIQNELKIKFMDFTVDKKTLNFITPDPPKLEALEEFREERFAIPQLQSILQELQLIADSTGSSEMQVVELASLLFSKVKLSKAFNGFDSGMPEMWNKLALQDMVGIVRMLDPQNTGYVNWKTLFTFMALEQSPVPQKVDMSSIKQENGFAEKADFNAHKWWFAETEKSKDRDYAHTFERVKLLTALLFEANKTTVEGGREVICLSEWERRVTQGYKKNRVFHDLLFGGQKH